MDDWRNAFGILMCREMCRNICDDAGEGICDGAPSTCSSFYGALWCSGKASDEIERYRVRSPLTASVVSLSKRLYPHCLVLVSTQEKRGPHGRLVLDY